MDPGGSFFVWGPRHGLTDGLDRDAHTHLKEPANSVPFR